MFIPEFRYDATRRVSTGFLQRALQDNEMTVGCDAGDLVVERTRTDPGDLAVGVLVCDVDQAGDEHGLTKAAPAVGFPGAGRAEPAEAAVVAVVRGERAVGAVFGGRDVDAGGGGVGERACELERPGAAEVARDGGDERALVAPGAADLVAARGGRGGELGGAGGSDARVVADGDQDVFARVAGPGVAAALEPVDGVLVADVDAGREVVARRSEEHTSE